MFYNSKFSLPLLLCSIGAGICLFSCGGGGSNQNTYLPIGTILEMSMVTPNTNLYPGTIRLTVTGNDYGTVVFNSTNGFPGDISIKSKTGSNIPFYYWPDPCKFSITFNTAQNYALLPGPIVALYSTNYTFSAKMTFKKNDKQGESVPMTYTYRVESGDGSQQIVDIPDYRGTGTARKSNSSNIGGN